MEHLMKSEEGFVNSRCTLVRLWTLTLIHVHSISFALEKHWKKMFCSDLQMEFWIQHSDMTTHCNTNDPLTHIWDYFALLFCLSNLLSWHFCCTGGSCWIQTCFNRSNLEIIQTVLKTISQSPLCVFHFLHAKIKIYHQLFARFCLFGLRALLFWE